MTDAEQPEARWAMENMHQLTELGNNGNQLTVIAYKHCMKKQHNASKRM
jgi:hypothetical protein